MHLGLALIKIHPATCDERGGDQYEYCINVQVEDLLID